MIPRVLEPEMMDSPAEAVDYDAMDHRAVNSQFVDDFLAAWVPPVPDRNSAELLDLGTGTAQIPVELCRRLGAVRVIAVDAAENMLKVGRRNVATANMELCIFLERADAKRLPYDTGRFAAVFSNSIIHHIADPREALSEAIRVTLPGGFLFFRDLIRPHDEAILCRLVDTYAANANHRQRQMLADSLRAALSLDEIRRFISDLGFSPDTVQATSDRHWTWCATATAYENT